MKEIVLYEGPMIDFNSKRLFQKHDDGTYTVYEVNAGIDVLSGVSRITTSEISLLKKIVAEKNSVPEEELDLKLSTYVNSTKDIKSVSKEFLASFGNTEEQRQIIRNISVQDRPKAALERALKWPLTVKGFFLYPFALFTRKVLEPSLQFIGSKLWEHQSQFYSDEPLSPKQMFFLYAISRLNQFTESVLDREYHQFVAATYLGTEFAEEDMDLALKTVVNDIALISKNNGILAMNTTVMFRLDSTIPDGKRYYGVLATIFVKPATNAVLTIESSETLKELMPYLNTVQRGPEGSLSNSMYGVGWRDRLIKEVVAVSNKTYGAFQVTAPDQKTIELPNHKETEQ
jgi:hypothetical protein